MATNLTSPETAAPAERTVTTLRCLCGRGGGRGRIGADDHHVAFFQPLDYFGVAAVRDPEFDRRRFGHGDFLAAGRPGFLEHVNCTRYRSFLSADRFTRSSKSAATSETALPPFAALTAAAASATAPACAELRLCGNALLGRQTVHPFPDFLETVWLSSFRYPGRSGHFARWTRGGGGVRAAARDSARGRGVGGRFDNRFFRRAKAQRGIWNPQRIAS